MLLLLLLAAAAGGRLLDDIRAGGGATVAAADAMGASGRSEKSNWPQLPALAAAVDVDAAGGRNGGGRVLSAGSVGSRVDDEAEPEPDA